ncbi:unnamed protein product, partial [Mesorhabditis belari]|uniref:Carboxylic ester hydrolase n=1 Tax=Mesorhabditis belari TaxID=2138241 RepID=A0AAF3FDF9_9BILA
MLLFLIFFSLIEIIVSQNPLVITKYGPVVGTTYTTTNGAKVSEFIGVPFAAPPIGNLRFEKPQPPIPWTAPKNVVAYQPACVPCEREQYTFSEDCLYLNIWTPSLNNTLFPVVIYIHDGGYRQGSGVMNNRQMREIYAQNGIVFISIQYRVGFLGFMTLNDTRLPANLGLWDQNMALRWVQENIGKFGGDSKRVTIWGTSAGSSSVGQHTLSPKSQGLFQQAFEQSASPIAAFARGNENVEFAMNTIIQLGCSTHGDVKSCLCTKSLDEFFNVSQACHYNDLTIFAVSPMIDGDFFTEQPEQAIQNAPVIPTLIGLNSNEGRIFTLGGSLPFSLAPQSWNSMTDDVFYDLIEQWVANRGYNEQAQQAAEDIFQFYAQNNKNASDHYFWIEQWTRLFTDFFFNVPAVREAVLKSQAKSPVYTFVLDYFNQETWPANYPCQGSTHESEMPYCLGESVNFTPTQEDITVANLMREFIIQFIKTGNPNIAAFKWDPFTANQLQYLSFKPKPSMVTGFFGDSYNFWTKTMRKYSFDFVTRRGWSA